jgi:hypothetical protein
MRLSILSKPSRSNSKEYDFTTIGSCVRRYRAAAEPQRSARGERLEGIGEPCTFSESGFQSLTASATPRNPQSRWNNRKGVITKFVMSPDRFDPSSTTGERNVVGGIHPPTPQRHAADNNPSLSATPEWFVNPRHARRPGPGAEASPATPAAGTQLSRPATDKLCHHTPP